jgi:hypothetical protein
MALQLPKTVGRAARSLWSSQLNAGTLVVGQLESEPCGELNVAIETRLTTGKNVQLKATYTKPEKCRGSQGLTMILKAKVDRRTGMVEAPRDIPCCAKKDLDAD